MWKCHRKSKKIDSIIDEYSIDWKLDRLANVDKNILRFSIFEIIFREDIPYEVTINEAVEITKNTAVKILVDLLMVY